jgi:hypothetical protein
MGKAHEYTFDVKLAATMKVKADSQEEDAQILERHCDYMEIGCEPHQHVMLESATIDDSDGPLLTEIDGEEVEEEVEEEA